MRVRALTLLALVVAVGACRGSSRVPASHRQAASSCPRQRGPGISMVGSACAGGSLVTCAKDADCTKGMDGRCLQGGGPACSYGCTYDDCFDDADCTGNAPCACRASDTDTTANACATQSNCRVDSDCGLDGHCSPSLVLKACSCASEVFCKPGSGQCTVNGVEVPCECPGDCGHGYFCHTPDDSCVDDSDCTVGNTCAFDRASKKWLCTDCIGP